MAEDQTWWKGPSNTTAPETIQQSSEPRPMSDLREDVEETIPNRRVHILGMGSIGTLIAHSLRCMPNPPPITLLLHREELYEQFKMKQRKIRLINKKTGINDEQYGYDVDLLERAPDDIHDYWKYIPNLERGEPTNPLQEEERLDSEEVYIANLIVTVKGPATVAALQSVRHRLNAQSTICLAQNGLGQIDELNTKVFTDPTTRPTYLLAIISHGCYMTGQFTVVHAGLGTTSLGIYRDTDKFPLPPKNQDPNIGDLPEEQRKKMYPTDKELYSNLSARFMLRTLTRSTVLACASFPYLDLFQLQLEKLTSNAIINPITAVLDIQNGLMLNNNSLNTVQRLLLTEISLVIRNLPELEGIPGIQTRFSPQRLELYVRNMAEKTAANSSSMREDMRNGKNTEVDYINGYIVRRGEEQGIKCVLNFMLQHLVKGKSWIRAKSDETVIPYGTSRVQGEIEIGQLGSSDGVVLEDTGSAARVANR